jgi:hypothetical protein
MTSIQDMLAFERLIPERLRFEVTQWAIDHECTPHRGGRPPIELGLAPPQAPPKKPKLKKFS